MISRPEVKNISFNGIEEISEEMANSFKHVWLIPNYLHSLVMSFYEMSGDWEIFSDSTSFLGFTSLAMYQSSFYFRMIEQTMNRLIDTGVINYLVDGILKEKLNIKRSKDFPKVLNLKDLSFGFIIWIGFCCISILSFAIEILFSKLYIKC